MNSDVGGAYDRFRAVHDALGHAGMELGFDRDGEFAVWLFQEQFHSPLARRALATELHAQHSVRWTTGDVAEPKAVLLDPALLSRTRPPRSPSPARRSVNVTPVEAVPATAESAACVWASLITSAGPWPSRVHPTTGSWTAGGSS